MTITSNGRSVTIMPSPINPAIAIARYADGSFVVGPVAYVLADIVAVLTCDTCDDPMTCIARVDMADGYRADGGHVFEPGNQWGT